MKHLILSGIFTFSILQAAPLYLTPQNCETDMKDAKQSGHSHSSSGATTMYQVVGLDGSYEANGTYILSNLEQTSLKLNANLISITKSKYDNYHCLVVNGNKGNEFFTAITYISKNGKPSKKSPTKITSLQKGILELEPILLPREHDRFMALRTYLFTLKFSNKPLPNQEIFIKLDEKDELVGKTDNDGKISVTLKDTFQDVQNNKRGNKPKEFVLFAKFNKNDAIYNTSLRGEYYVNPTAHWQSVPAGFGVASLGFLLGLLLYRRAKNG